MVAKKVINYRFSATPQQVTGRTRAHDVRCTIRPSLLERDSHGSGCYHHFMTTAPNLNWIANYIWGIADDVLRDVYVRGKYRDVILPMTVLRRLDAVLEPTKQAVLDMKASLDAAGVANQDAALRQASGQAFHNTSKFTLKDLRARSGRQQLRADFEDYLDGFSPNVQDILDNFEFRNQIPRLSRADALGSVIEKLTSPDVVPRDRVLGIESHRPRPRQPVLVPANFSKREVPHKPRSNMVQRLAVDIDQARGAGSVPVDSTHVIPPPRSGVMGSVSPAWPRTVGGPPLAGWSDSDFPPEQLAAALRCCRPRQVYDVPDELMEQVAWLPRHGGDGAAAARSVDGRLFPGEPVAPGAESRTHLEPVTPPGGPSFHFHPLTSRGFLNRHPPPIVDSVAVVPDREVSLVGSEGPN